MGAISSSASIYVHQITLFLLFKGANKYQVVNLDLSIARPLLGNAVRMIHLICKNI